MKKNIVKFLFSAASLSIMLLSSCNDNDGNISPEKVRLQKNEDGSISIEGKGALLKEDLINQGIVESETEELVNTFNSIETLEKNEVAEDELVKSMARVNSENFTCDPNFFTIHRTRFAGHKSTQLSGTLAPPFDGNYVVRFQSNISNDFPYAVIYSAHPGDLAMSYSFLSSNPNKIFFEFVSNRKSFFWSLLYAKITLHRVDFNNGNISYTQINQKRIFKFTRDRLIWKDSFSLVKGKTYQIRADYLSKETGYRMQTLSQTFSHRCN